MIAAAMWFNSGILLVADAEASGKTPTEPRKIFPKKYGTAPGCACSICVVSEANDGRVAALHQCETALAALEPADSTIERMRHTVQQALVDTADDEVDFVVLYSPGEQRYALYRTTGTMLQEVVGYDCEGSAAYLGHCFMHEPYQAARSMDALDLATVFSIAVDTLEGVRAAHAGCGKSSEMVVMYADGHVSDVQRIPHDTSKQRSVALSVLGHT